MKTKNNMKTNLRDIDFNTDQKNFISLLINCFGSGQHPYCYEQTFDYFTISYLKQIVKKKTVTKNITEDGIRMLNELKITLSNS